jgi:hypothetical protein
MRPYRVTFTGFGMPMANDTEPCTLLTCSVHRYYVEVVFIESNVGHVEL